VLRKIRENASQSELLQGASNVKKRSPEVFSAGSDTSSKRRRIQYEIFQSDQNVDFTKEIQLSSIELDVLGHRKLDYGTNSIFFRENIQIYLLIDNSVLSTCSQTVKMRNLLQLTSTMGGNRKSQM